MSEEKKEKRQIKRVTSVREIEKKTISKHNALDLMKNSKGHFFTVVFRKKDGTLRKINSQYLKEQDQSELGYVKVRELSKLKKSGETSIRSINLQTIESLVIEGRTFTIKS